MTELLREVRLAESVGRSSVRDFPVLVAEPPAGPVRGRLESGIAAFLGIPYALPPVGHRRFGPPEPMNPWSEVSDAFVSGPAAPQGQSMLAPLLGPDPGPQSEAGCLTLNVYGPPGASGLPVLVWIHGGGFRTGRAGGPRQAAHGLARLGPMVVVTVNYRLGPLGSLYLAELAADLGHGNFALLDQAAALEWVARNIVAFGGDPGRITVGGHSAGALSAAALACSPPPGVRIGQLVLQSAPLEDVGSAAEATMYARALVDALGIPRDALHRLRELPAETLIQAAGALPERFRATPMVVVGGAGLERAPLDPATRLPPGLGLLAGTVRDEGAAFLPPGAQSEEVEALTERYFVDPLDRFCGRVAAGSPLGISPFRYRFDWHSPTQRDRFAVGHGIDVPLVLGDAAAWASAPALKGASAAEIDALRAEFGGALAGFVCTGHPGSGWRTWTPAEGASALHRFPALATSES